VDAASEMADLALRESTHGWGAESLAKQLQRDGNRAWVVRKGGVLVGFLLVERVLDELTVLNIVVEPESRRRGIGEQMLTRALADASDSGVDVVHLELRASNVAAKALYEGLGFRVVGKRPRYYERSEDAVLMSLKLQ
jgi:ribosomal-protein-alanine N-acetyltransferase